ncbi:MAG: DUF2336 domain-containing protein [Verrucomicrobiota bacterium]
MSTLFDASLAELSDLPLARVSALLHDRGGASLQALLRRAGLPDRPSRRSGPRSRRCHEVGFVGSDGGSARLRRRMVERVLTHCETDPRSDRAAADPAAALRDRIGARGSAAVLRRARGGRSAIA